MADRHPTHASRAAAVRARRQRARESEIPDAFTCHGCDKPIEGIVVFWWNGKWGVGRAHDITWCEPCWAAMRTAEDRALKENGSAVLNRVIGLPNPAADGYDPFARIGHFDPRPCGHCGRLIRWGDPMGFCCERCAYEDKKAGRRVDRIERPCSFCGKPFTPKRKDAMTCSDRCRQAKRRMHLSIGRATSVTDSGVARARARTADADSRDNGEGN
jgi:endogenous inhibitor of DNA gyrase (YacG/DUF329 family)